MGYPRAGVVAVAAGAAVVAAGANVLAATADPVAPEVFSATPAEPGHANEGKYTAAGYRLHVHEVTGDGAGMGTSVEPHTAYYSENLHGDGAWRPKLLKFSVGRDTDGATVFTYPVPAPGRGVDCVASGTEQAPRVRCETKLSTRP
ncbi:hypothetical protein [Amycolatopsis sp. NPDC004378]